MTYLGSAYRFRGTSQDITQSAASVFTNALFVQNLYDFFDARPRIELEKGLRPAAATGRIEVRDASFTYPGASA